MFKGNAVVINEQVLQCMRSVDVSQLSKLQKKEIKRATYCIRETHNTRRFSINKLIGFNKVQEGLGGSPGSGPFPPCHSFLLPRFLSGHTDNV